MIKKFHAKFLIIKQVTLNILAKLLLIYFINCSNAISATVTSITQNTAMGHGLVSQGDSGGTISSNTGCTIVTGTVKTIGTNASFPCANASFIVSGTNNSTGTNRNRVTIVVPNNFTINTTGGSAVVTLSLSAANTTTKTLNVNLSGAAGGAGTVTVPVYGILTLTGTQTTGDYNGSYSIMACNNSLTVC